MFWNVASGGPSVGVWGLQTLAPPGPPPGSPPGGGPPAGGAPPPGPGAPLACAAPRPRPAPPPGPTPPRPTAQVPERSGLPSAALGAGAVRSSLPSGVFGTPVG